MHDAGKILVGLVIGLALLGFPLWWNAGKAAAAPEPSLDTPVINELPVRECVEPTAYMRANHMRLLDFWRDDVVRNGNRVYLNTRGQEHEMSLQKTCGNCHSNVADFCDRCHNYLAVEIYCWDCHVSPEALP